MGFVMVLCLAFQKDVSKVIQMDSAKDSLTERLKVIHSGSLKEICLDCQREIARDLMLEILKADDLDLPTD
jgi:hypothetical protein